MEALPAVIAADVVALVVADMAICSYEDADSVCCCRAGLTCDQRVESNVDSIFTNRREAA